MKYKGEVVGLSTHCTSTGGLTLAGCQIPTQPLSRSPFSTEQGEKIRWKVCGTQ